MKASIPHNYHLPPYLAGVARATPDKWGEGGSCFGEMRGRTHGGAGRANEPIIFTLLFEGFRIFMLTDAAACGVKKT